MQVRDWDKSPRQIMFGEDMVLTDIAIDKDHILTLYTEKKMVDKWDFFVYIKPHYVPSETLVEECCFDEETPF
jgi:hypothetical protein